MVEHDFPITIEERDALLKGIEIQRIDLFKQTRRRPLTLTRQTRLAGSVGFGNVNFEAKRLGEIKKKSRRKGLSILRTSRAEVLKKKIKEDPPIIPLSSFEPDLSSFQLDTGIDI